MAAALSWVRGLRSVGLCEDLLTTHHGFAGGTSTREAARAIAAHAEVAVSLLEQALAGPAHVSYVAAYYGLLDLAKVVVIASGALERLRKEKFHGMSWTGINTLAQDLQTDHITLHRNGAGALFYKALTGTSWVTASRTKRKIYMRDVYPYIKCIAFEYSQTYNVSRLAPLTCEVHELEENKAHVHLDFFGKPTPTTVGRSHFKILTGLKKLKGTHNTYVSESFQFSSGDDLMGHASQALPRRFLLYTLSASAPLRRFTVHEVDGELIQLPGRGEMIDPQVRFQAFTTPVSNSTLLLPEELPILLAFFHLGNVARYDPARLARLRDSKACAIIDVLLAEGIFAFIVDVWSYLTNCSHVFTQ